MSSLSLIREDAAVGQSASDRSINRYKTLMSMNAAMEMREQISKIRGSTVSLT